MNVSIDTSPLSNANAIRGIGRYTRELVSGLRALSTEHTFYTSQDQSTGKIDLIHYPFFDLFFPTLPLRKRTKTIVTVHDVIPLLFPKHYPPGIRGSLGLLHQKVSLRSVAHIITDSESSKRDIIEHLRWRSEHISVVPLAASPLIARPTTAVCEKVRKSYGLPKHFTLYVGDINYNKNIPFLLSAIQKVPRLSLVLVGKAFHNIAVPEGRAIQDAIRTFQLEKKVRIIDSLGPDAMTELSAIYALATVYVQPSLYEGFGLPVLEAMQAKTPVVCARAGSLPEVAGDAAQYFHPMEEESLVAALQRVLRYTKLQRASMVKKGIAQAAQFSWQRTAQETLAVYMKVAQA